jgi:hypothetical protein
VIGVAWGVAALFVFRRFTDRPALRTVLKRLHAHLLEIRLYSEEPALVFRAQGALLVDNLRFLALVSKPVLMMAVPFALLYSPLDAIYGWSPIEVGHSAVVTVQMPGELAGGEPYTLQVPPGIAVETPAVRDLADRRISWRIRALAPVRGNLGFQSVSRSIAAGEGTLSLNRRRESPHSVSWIEVDYPKAEITIAGLSLPWLAWFLIISTASAALFAVRPGR